MQGPLVFDDGFCSWRLEFCLGWLWYLTCIVLLVSAVFHQIQGISCRAVLGISQCGSFLPCLHSSKKSVESFDFCNMWQNHLFQTPLGWAGAADWDEVLLICLLTGILLSWAGADACKGTCVLIIVESVALRSLSYIFKKVIAQHNTSKVLSQFGEWILCVRTLVCGVTFLMFTVSSFLLCRLRPLISTQLAKKAATEEVCKAQHFS